MSLLSERLSTTQYDEMQTVKGLEIELINKLTDSIVGQMKAEFDKIVEIVKEQAEHLNSLKIVVGGHSILLNNNHSEFIVETITETLKDLAERINALELIVKGDTIIPNDEHDDEYIQGAGLEATREHSFVGIPEDEKIEGTITNKTEQHN